MATNYKVLSQKVVTTANTAVSAYTVPSSTQAIVSSISVCNTDTTGKTFDISIKKSGDSSTSAYQYVVKGQKILAAQNVTYTLGITLATGDQVFVNSSSTLVAFNLFGTELA
jgi:hypothetical protein